MPESAPPAARLPHFDLGRIRTVLCDLDGVVWLAHRPIAGAVEAIAACRAAGRRVMFVTNNSMAQRSQHEAALAAIGIEAHGAVVSSAMAAARLVAPGERVLVTGGRGIIEAVESRGAVALANVGRAPIAPIDVVVVGLDREFDYQRLKVAADAIHAGARLIGTNSDATYPTPDGLEPGGGAMLAAIATAGGRSPLVAGKPHEPMAALLAELLELSAGNDGDTLLMVGDRPETDGLMAARLGCPFALVRTGVTAPGDDVAGVDAALDVADLAAVVAHLGAC